MILITGATGLTGAHLALHLLESGKTVRATYRSRASIQHTKSLFVQYDREELFDRIEWVRADITNIPELENAFQNVDAVYHCAAFISFDPADEELLRRTNIEGTANIVNCCLAFHVKKLCHISSIAALGDLKDVDPALAREPQHLTVTEESEWNPEKPHSDYAISKYGAEMEVWRGFQEGLSVVIINPGVILGPGFFDSGSGEIFSKVIGGLKFYTKGKTGFVDVRDVALAAEKLMDSETSGERFILVSETLSFKNLLTNIALQFKVGKPDVYAKPWMTTLAYNIDWLLSLLGKKRVLTKDGARSLHSVTYYSNKKIEEVLGISFIPVSESIAHVHKFRK